MAEHREIAARIGGDGQFSLQCARGAGYIHGDPAGYWKLGPYHRVGSFEKALEIFRQIHIFLCSALRAVFTTLRAAGGLAVGGGEPEILVVNGN